MFYQWVSTPTYSLHLGEVARVTEALEARLRDAPLTPVHGDLALMQVFVHADRAFFIDFDGFCRSHPALDLANLTIALGVSAMVLYGVYRGKQKREAPEVAFAVSRSGGYASLKLRFGAGR